MKGFTLFETVLVLIILSFILGFGFYYFNQLSQTNFIFEENLKITLNFVQITREKSLLGENNSTWGIGFINSSTGSYIQIVKDSSSNLYLQYDLPKNLIFVNPPSGYIFFEKFTGKTTGTNVGLKNKINNALKYICIPTSSSPFISPSSTCSRF
ncbi:hypothetical protein HRbin35_00644 [bacterium HR35]|nr:hypothetical protein HRbin35_00644 [bacterium HR35]